VRIRFSPDCQHPLDEERQSLPRLQRAALRRELSPQAAQALFAESMGWAMQARQAQRRPALRLAALPLFLALILAATLAAPQDQLSPLLSLQASLESTF
tara:strand:+ start:346 stop:642 length:297 start_codon:yes stop_codon:yes gene_type:complete